MNTQPNIMVALLIALVIHIAIVGAVLWERDMETVQFAEIAQGIEIQLDRNAYQNIVQKQQEKKQQEEVKQAKVEPVKPKKKKPKKLKAIQQKVTTKKPKTEMVTYKAREDVAEKVEPVIDAVAIVAPETVKVASTADKLTQVAHISAMQQKAEGVGKAQKPLDMNDNSTQRYIAQLMRHLNRYKHYPAQLKKNHIEGKPVVRFSINKSGHVTLVEVKRHTKYAELDQAAMEVFRRASPLPKIPSELERETLTMSLPMEYSLIND